MTTDFNAHLNSLDNTVHTNFSSVNSCLLSAETILQQQLPTIKSDISKLTVNLHNTNKTIDQKLEDTIQDLPFILAASSTFTSSIDLIVHDHISTFPRDLSTSIKTSPSILQLQADIQQLQNSTSLPDLVPIITQHIDTSPMITHLRQQMLALQTPQ